MNNKQIALTLDDIADMLEILGETHFKIQAYHRASHKIWSMTDDINDLAARDELTEITGVGKSIAEKIDELLKTGKIQYFEELKEQVPPSVLLLMEIPNVGPKKAKLFYDALGVHTVDELLDAARDKRLQTLPGIKEKTELKIIEGIKQLRIHRERTPLHEALAIAAEMIESLRQTESVAAIDFAGSLRRMCETIGDIDILVASSSPDKAMTVFCSDERVEKVLSRGETKCSILTHGSLQVDVRVVEPDVYGAALIYFTGSKEHNIHIRDIAKRCGFKLSEYGLFEQGSDKPVAARTEEDVYKMIGLDYIVPQLREDRGEVEAAATGRLPHLIERSDIRGDLHVHSNFSDGAQDIEEIVKYAIDLGYEYIAIADHAKNLKIAHGLDEERLKQREEAIEILREKYPDFGILSAIELNIDNDGGLDYPDHVLAGFDIVLASIHSGFNQDREIVTSRIVRTMENEHVNIICHPTGRILGRRFGYDLDIKKVIETASITNTVLELNAYPDRLDLNDEHLKMAIEAGVRIAINTDTHLVENLDYMIYGIETAKRGWVEKKDVINTMNLGELVQFLRKD